MKKMSKNQLRNLEGGKFWGRSCGGGSRISSTHCLAYCKYQIFWFKVSEWYDIVYC